MTFIWSCSDDEASNKCVDDYAEFYYEDTLFRTSYTPDMGELFNPRPESCGTAATLSENSNSFQLRLGVEGQAINMIALVPNLFEKYEFTDIDYENFQFEKTFNTLIPNFQNYIQINELDIYGNSIKGEFSFKLKNSTGDTIIITNGKFNCPYQEI